MRARALIVASAIFAGMLAGSGSVAQNKIRETVAVVTPDGSPVTNLAQTDFNVKEAGSVRTITGFSGSTAVPAKPVASEPGQFTNFSDAAGGAIFVVLDTIHTRYSDERDMRELILKAMVRAAQAKRPVTLSILSDTGLHVYHDFRSGSDVLLAGLVKAGLGGAKGQPAPAGVTDADATAEAARLTAFAKGDQSNSTPENALLRSNINMPLIMFQDVAHAAYGLPGRKMLVWVTNAIPFDIDPKTMAFESPKQSNRGVAVNGVAAGGMKNALSDAQIKEIKPVWRSAMHALFEAGVAIYPVESRSTFAAASGTLAQDLMKQLALITGGKASLGSNDPFPELMKAAAGNSAGYALNYVSDTKGNEFRRTQVSTENSNNTVLQAAGYFPAEPVTKESIGQDLGLATQSPLEYTGVFFSVQVKSIEDGAAGKKKVNLVISIPGSSGVLNEAERKVDVAFVAVAKNAKGETVGNMNEGAGGQFPPEAVATIKEMGFQLKRSFEVAPGDSTVHFIMRDNQNGLMGSIIFPLKVQ